MLLIEERSGEAKPYQWLNHYLHTFGSQTKFPASMLLKDQAAVILGVDIAGGGAASDEAHLLCFTDEERVGVVLGSLLSEPRASSMVPLAYAIRVFHLIRAVDTLVARVRQKAGMATGHRIPLYVVVEANYAFGGYLYQQLFYQLNVHTRAKHVTVFFAPDIQTNMDTVGILVSGENKPPRYDLFETIMHTGRAKAFTLGVVDCFKWTNTFKGLLSAQGIFATLVEQTTNMKVTKQKMADGTLKAYEVKGKELPGFIGKDDLYMCVSNTFAWIDEFMKRSGDEKTQFALRCRELEITRFKNIHKTLALQPSLNAEIISESQSVSSVREQPCMRGGAFSKPAQDAIAVQTALYGAAVRMLNETTKLLRWLVVQLKRAGFAMPTNHYVYSYKTKSTRYKQVVNREGLVDTNGYTHEVVCVSFKDATNGVFGCCPTFFSLQKSGSSVNEILLQFEETALRLHAMGTCAKQFLIENHPDPQYPKYATMLEQPVHEVVHQIQTLRISLQPLGVLEQRGPRSEALTKQEQAMPILLFQAYAALGTCLRTCRVVYRKARHTFLTYVDGDEGCFIQEGCVMRWTKKSHTRITYRQIVSKLGLKVTEDDITEHINYKIF